MKQGSLFFILISLSVIFLLPYKSFSYSGHPHWYGGWRDRSAPHTNNDIFYIDLNSIKTLPKGLKSFKDKDVVDRSSVIYSNYLINCKKGILTERDLNIYHNNKFVDKISKNRSINIKNIDKVDSQVLKGNLPNSEYINKVYKQYYRTVCK